MDQAASSHEDTRPNDIPPPTTSWPSHWLGLGIEREREREREEKRKRHEKNKIYLRLSAARRAILAPSFLTNWDRVSKLGMGR